MIGDLNEPMKAWGIVDIGHLLNFINKYRRNLRTMITMIGTFRSHVSVLTKLRK